MTKRNVLLTAFAVASIAIAAGCGGGSNGPLVPVPTTSPTQGPAPQSTAVSLSSSSTTVATVSAGTATAAITFPAVTGATGTVTVAGSATLPSGFVALAKTRAISRRDTSPGPPTLIAYVSIVATASFTFPTNPSFSFTIPPACSGTSCTPANTQYYIAYYASGATSWVEPAEGPATVTVGTNSWTLAFAGSNQPVSVAAGQTYSFALYSVPAGTYATASPSSSPTASPSSSASPTASPSSNPTTSPSSNPTTSPSSNPTTSPTASPTSSPTSSPTTAPTSVPATWTFGGSTASLNVTTSSTAAMASGTDVNAAVSVTMPTLVSGSGTLQFSDALNKCCGVSTSDVSPATLPADNASTSLTNPALYISIYNPGTTDISYGSKTPAVTISGLSPSTPPGVIIEAAANCELDVYANNSGTGFTWNPTGSTVSTSGGQTSITLPSVTLPSGSTVDFKPGQTVVAVSCD